MARPLRLEFPGALYHITSRGNHGEDVFPDADHRHAFLDILAGAIRRYNWICHAYCLMGNHYHLLIETPDGNLSKGMRQVNAVYTQYFNREKRKSGHLFQGRYKSIIVEKDSHLLEVIRYVVLNPVRAGVCALPEEWAWSSYRGYLGLEPSHECLSVERVLENFGKSRKAAVTALKLFVRDGLKAETPFAGVRGQVLLGSDDFIEMLDPYLKRYADIREVPAMQRLAGRPTLPDLFSGSRKRAERDDRIVEAVERHGYSQKEVADHLSRHYSTVSRIVSRAEKSKSKDLTPKAS